MPSLKVKLFPGWRESNHPGALVTYVRDASQHSGALQFSLAHHKPGALPISTEGMLVELCKKLSSKVNDGKIVSSKSGKCGFGLFGTVTVRGTSPVHFQAWVLSNQRDFILITHTCMEEPDPKELQEAEQIALLTGCG